MIFVADKKTCFFPNQIKYFKPKPIWKRVFLWSTFFTTCFQHWTIATKTTGCENKICRQNIYYAILCSNVFFFTKT